METESNDIFKGLDEITNSEGWRITEKIRALQLSYTVFQRNYEDLKGILDAYSQKTDLALHLMASDNRESLDAFLGEVTRFLHNFLSSVKTLVDHTRAFCQDEYSGTEFSSVYQKRVNETFIEDPLVKFVQDLRNFALHKSLPITGARIIFGTDSGMCHSITMDIDSLRDWDGWTAKARDFITSVNKDIVLEEVINKYAEITSEFYEWFGECQRSIHQQAISELKELQDKQRELMRKCGYAEDLLH